MADPAPPRDALTFPSSEAEKLTSYLPSPHSALDSLFHPSKPFVTLTFATSLDSSISLAPGVQTALSGPQSKSMTHYLRSKHDAILIGCGTAIADDPSLNCRIEGVGGYGGKGLEGQPRPVVLDPKGRWNVTAESKVIKLAQEGRGKGPWVVMWEDMEKDVEKERILESVGGKIFRIPRSEDGSKADWRTIFSILSDQGLRSVMIEGGGAIINDLLHPKKFGLVDSVIVTIAPTWLGRGGVQVCPEESVEEGGARVPVGRLRDVKWVPLGEDVVLCGRP
jgi:2,5-diamino-6-(ribosylamino)-4(3H)-pyrimidinone 5'-phosphate reductase